MRPLASWCALVGVAGGARGHFGHGILQDDDHGVCKSSLLGVVSSADGLQAEEQGSQSIEKKK